MRSNQKVILPPAELRWAFPVPRLDDSDWICSWLSLLLHIFYGIVSFSFSGTQTSLEHKNSSLDIKKNDRVIFSGQLEDYVGHFLRLIIWNMPSLDLKRYYTSSLFSCILISFEYGSVISQICSNTLIIKLIHLDFICHYISCWSNYQNSSWLLVAAYRRHLFSEAKKNASGRSF